MDVGSLFVKLGLSVEDFERGMKSAEGKLQNFGKAATKAGKDLSMKVTAPITLLGVSTLKTAGDFESAMNRVAAISGATGSQLEAMTAQARELGATTQFSASQAADAMTFLSMAGFQANEIMEAMPSTLTLAAAAQLDMGTAADIVSNIMSGFGMNAEELSGAVDVLTKQFTTSNTNLQQLGEAMKYAAPVAASLGVSIQEASAAIGIMSDAGIQASMAGTGLRGILSTLAQDGKKLGINVFDASGQMRPFADILEELGTKGLSTSKIMEVFGERAGPAMLTLLSAGSKAMRDQISVLEQAGGTAQRIADTQMQGLNGQLKALRSAFEELQLAIGESGLLNSVTSFAKRLTEVIRNLSQTNPQMLKMGVIAAGLAAAIGPVLIIIGQMSTGMAAILRILPALIGGMKALGLAMTSTPWGAVAAIVGVLAAATLPKLISMLTGADGKFKSVTKSVEDLQGATETLKKAQDDLLEVMSDSEGATEDQIKLSKEQARQHIINADAAIKEAQALRQLLIERRKDVLVAMQRSKIGGGTQVGEIQAIEAEIKRLEASMEEAELTSFRMAAILDSLGDTAPAVAKVAPEFVSIGEEAQRAEIHIDRLRNSFEKLELQMSLAKAAQEALDRMSRQLGATQNMHAAMVTNLSNRLAGLNTTMYQSNQATNTMSQQQAAAMVSLSEAWSQATEQIAGVTQSYLVDGLSAAFAQMGANMAAGVSIMSNVKNIVLGTLADLAIQVGKIAIGVGLSVKGIKAALKSLNPIVAIAAGAALIALGGAARAALAKSAEKAGGVPAFANGGIVSGPTLGLMGEYAGARSNPEVIAPLNKLQSMLGGTGGEVTFRIEGRELVGILSREGSLAKRV